jgi:GWxTD domain-containing protein
MNRWVRRFLQLFASAILAWPFLSFAQDQLAPPDNTAKPQTSKEAKKRDKKLMKELSLEDSNWLLNEVSDIITPEERRAFLELGTQEEREQFIEHTFWDPRNPDPDSLINLAREEHYRRLAYADERFASGIPGRKTDRGHIYIIWGPADEIESHPTGGTYDRSPQQGGGSSSAYAWELWRYRHLQGIGENIEIEFVDPTGSGEYHITNDPCEKDALAHVPGAGPSLSEIIGQSTKASRFSNSNGTTCPMPIGGTTASPNEFDALDRYFRVQRSPEHLNGLLELVNARVVHNDIHMDYRTDFLRVTSSTVFVPITVQVSNRELSFQSKQGVHSAVLNLYGRITTPGGVVVQTFEDLVSCDFPESLFPSALNLSSIYQKAVPLRSGLYRLDLVIKDTLSGNLGVFNTVLRVPRFADGKLDASSLILADQIATVPASQTGAGQFVLNSYKVRPRLSQEFSNTDTLGIFLQLYNLKLDETSHKTNVSIAYRITKDHQEIWRTVETPDRLHQGGEQLTIERLIPVASLVPGRYTIEVTAIDLLTDDTVIRTADFTVKPTPPAKPAAMNRKPSS